MRGREGLIFLVFGALLALLRTFNVQPFRSFDPQLVSVCYLLALFGLAAVLVGILARTWAATAD